MDQTRSSSYSCSSSSGFVAVAARWPWGGISSPTHRHWILQAFLQSIVQAISCSNHSLRLRQAWRKRAVWLLASSKLVEDEAAQGDLRLAATGKDSMQRMRKCEGTWRNLDRPSGLGPNWTSSESLRSSPIYRYYVFNSKRWTPKI